MAPHIGEVMNRSVTAIAAYDLQFNRLQKQGVPIAEASRQAIEYAADTISETQFNYQQYNKFRAIQKNPIARTALMYKQYPQHVYVYMLSRIFSTANAIRKQVMGEPMTPEEVREAKVQAKQLAYFVGMAVLATGAIGGTPEPIKYLLGMLSWLFTDEDNKDQPFNYELWVQQSMTDWLGPTWGDIGARGLPAAVGWDISGRAGINNLMLYEPPSLEDEDAFVSGVFQLITGPVGTMAVLKPYRAYSHIREGNYSRGFEEILPKAIRDPMRAMRFNTEGFATQDGRVYSSSENFSPLDFFLTSVGLNPVSTSKIYLSREIEAAERALNDKRSRLMREAYAAARSGTRGDKIKIMSRIRTWSRDNPTFSIDDSDLAKSFKARTTSQRNTQGGILVQKGHRQWADEQNRFR
jgi:hypothetical protein